MTNIWTEVRPSSPPNTRYMERQHSYSSRLKTCNRPLPADRGTRVKLEKGKVSTAGRCFDNWPPLSLVWGGPRAGEVTQACLVLT